MLAPSPSQHLESEIRPHGNPPYDSDIPNPALAKILEQPELLCEVLGKRYAAEPPVRGNDIAREPLGKREVNTIVGWMTAEDR